MRLYRLLILILICGSTALLSAQDSIPSDSVTTPFRKGRWLTGISGGISSSRVDIRSEDAESSSNEYNFNILGGNFVEDRWLVGGIIQMDRSDAEGLSDLTTESLFLGPLASRYLSDSDRGSIFILVSPGYTR